MMSLKELVQIIVIHASFFLFYSSAFIFYWYIIKGLIFGSLLVKTVICVYIIYILINYHVYHSAYDGNGPVFLRSKYFFGFMRGYFPVEIRKTAEIPPNRNYILAYFPHGLLTIGLSINLLHDIQPFLRLFPGIRPKVATLNVNFWTPVLREIWRWFGYIPVSKQSLLYYLNKSNDAEHPDNVDGYTSYMVGLSVGGAQESQLTEPGKYTILLKKRFGFVKLAIQTGSPIVPSFGFGENDLYTILDKSWFRPIQRFHKKYFGYVPVLMKGRFNFVLPYKKRVTLVVGSPIDVKRTTNPDPAYVAEIHAKVIEAVREIFETYKSEYIENSENVELVVT
uniref:Acyltransferase n=1 Tax=Zeugodacus cucurbitae TaxID=28588 RepID=A0A0A1WSL7_ZEUCU